MAHMPSTADKKKTASARATTYSLSVTRSPQLQAGVDTAGGEIRKQLFIFGLIDETH